MTSGDDTCVQRANGVLNTDPRLRSSTHQSRQNRLIGAAYRWLQLFSYRERCDCVAVARAAAVTQKCFMSTVGGETRIYGYKDQLKKIIAWPNGYVTERRKDKKGCVVVSFFYEHFSIGKLILLLCLSLCFLHQSAPRLSVSFMCCGTIAGE